MMPSIAPSTFCVVPPGKPDPYQPYEEGSGDSRRRVAAKESSIAPRYYAMNILRNRIGKAAPSSLQEERLIEKTFSAWRKELTAHLSQFPPNMMSSEEVKACAIHEKLLSQYGYSAQILYYKDIQRVLFQSISRENHTEWSDGYVVRLIGVPDQFSTECKSVTQLTLEYMLSSCPGTFFDYLCATGHLKEVQTTEHFLAPPTMSFEAGNLDGMPRDPRFYCTLFRVKPWDQLTDTEKAPFYKEFVHRAAYEKYGLKKCSWIPQDSFYGLRAELRTTGPLLVNGSYGHEQYSCEPVKSSVQVEGHDVYYWPKGSRIDSSVREAASPAQSIVVVGVGKREDQEVVYYIDAKSTDPQTEMSRKVYTISYPTFVAHCRDLMGRRTLTASREVGYLLARPDKRV